MEGNIGFLTNRAGRHKIPYHAKNNSFPSGEVARERIVFQVVRNILLVTNPLGKNKIIAPQEIILAQAAKPRGQE